MFESREMVHLAIDGMWQVFKLQRSTPRNDFCRIAAKNGMLPRLINTLHSLNVATRLVSMSRRPRSGQLDPNHPDLSQIETSVSSTDQSDVFKLRHGDHLPLSTTTREPSRASTSHTQGLDLPHILTMETDRPQISNSVAEIDLKSQRIPISANRTSTDKPLKVTDGASSGFSSSTSAQQEQVRPLLSLLEKEPPSRHFSGQLEYVRHLSGLERHESILPLLHATNDKKTNGELDLLMAEFAGFCNALYFFY